LTHRHAAADYTCGRPPTSPRVDSSKMRA
jgi:hypothetical protein